ncbi:glutathione S-transferase [Pseudomassariella vexata]|uniref:Glutathione S-transferase n=1 Tax=Pseudomassariella vexata TaxID=1141098 RepID=A0A1Y2ELE4_9PEZI|nr:glutathione S-transferase [Pseudomassariella vexata]ORY72096.1 glutathione S-transferase [Pseudomassariella vexata]
MAPFGTLNTVKLPNFVHPRSFKIFAAAKLNNLDFDIPPIKFGVTNKSPAFLAKFPLGQIPTFESPSTPDQDGEPFTLTESNAIAFYIASSGAKAGQLLGTNPEARAEIQKWIFFNELQFAPPVSKVTMWRAGMTQFNKEDEQTGKVDTEKIMLVLEGSLKGRKWLVKGEEGPTLADITISTTLYLGFQYYFDKEMRKRFPEIVRWYEQLKEVPELRELYDTPMVEKKEEAPE